jgi:hypothetical protein
LEMTKHRNSVNRFIVASVFRFNASTLQRLSRS